MELARDGLKGLELARSQPFSILILDLMLPGTDGVELLRRLRAARVSTHVLILNNRYPTSRLSGLNELFAPIPVRIRLILGKQIDPWPHEGRLVQLSSTGAELETKLSLEIFASVQVEIPGLLGKGVLIDGEVVSMGRDDHSYIIKFSDLDEAGATAVNLWLIQG